MGKYVKPFGNTGCCMLCKNWAGPRNITGSAVEADENVKAKCFEGHGSYKSPVEGHCCPDFNRLK